MTKPMMNCLVTSNNSMAKSWWKHNIYGMSYEQKQPDEDSVVMTRGVQRKRNRRTIDCLQWHWQVLHHHHPLTWNDQHCGKSTETDCYVDQMIPNINIAKSPMMCYPKSGAPGHTTTTTGTTTESNHWHQNATWLEGGQAVQGAPKDASRQHQPNLR
jgi:hypothetical protein